MNDKADFSGMNFPLINGIAEKTIGMDLLSVQPMTVQEAARGRVIKPYPTRYDDFKNTDDLEEYIRLELGKRVTLGKDDHIELNAQWLDSGLSVDLPLPNKDTYYTSGNTILNVTCYEPRNEKLFCCSRLGKTICQLNPERWGKTTIDGIIRKIKLDDAQNKMNALRVKEDMEKKKADIETVWNACMDVFRQDDRPIPLAVIAQNSGWDEKDLLAAFIKNTIDGVIEISFGPRNVSITGMMSKDGSYAFGTCKPKQDGRASS